MNIQNTAFENRSVCVPLPDMDWEAWTKPGAVGRVKLARAFGKRVRILELPSGFNEENWCTKGHQGYVLKGNFTVIFQSGEEFSCKTGDAFVIPDEIPHRSRGTLDSETVVFVIDEM